MPKFPRPSVFSNQVTLFSPNAAARTSLSPSLSKSAEYTNLANSVVVEMICWELKLPWPSVFSYQAILLSKAEAERTSLSPSPSISTAKTYFAPSALVVIIFCELKFPRPSVF